MAGKHGAQNAGVRLGSWVNISTVLNGGDVEVDGILLFQ